MARILLLVIFLLWIAATATPGQAASPVASGMSLGLFFGGYALLIGVMGLWSRRLAQRVADQDYHRKLGRFIGMMGHARQLVPVWFAYGCFGLGWTGIVLQWMGPMQAWQIILPGMVVGTLPAMLAWMGLWWAQFPAEMATREQNLLVHLDQNLPVHAPPGFRSYFGANLRLQILFTLIPVVIVILSRDIIVLVLLQFHSGTGISPALDTGITLGTAAVMFLFAPEILRRVLKTEPLPNSVLRRRLESLCRQAGLRYREILLWHTDGTMSNAAVMGLVPRWRYILLSDLLLETMSDQEIEAVFAHEAGHVVHRHLTWYGVFIVIATLAELGPGQWIEQQFAHMHLPEQDAVMLLLWGGGFLLVFGILSRQIERQADVFAARMIERARGSGVVVHVSSAEADAIRSRPSLLAAHNVSHVGAHGAAVFNSALQRVAVINNMSLRARNFFHGSIARRMDFLEHLSVDPSRTLHFDRGMARLYAGLIVMLVVAAAWAATTLWVIR